jgi:hypothetical protein
MIQLVYFKNNISIGASTKRGAPRESAPAQESNKAAAGKRGVSRQRAANLERSMSLRDKECDAIVVRSVVIRRKTNICVKNRELI